MFLYYITDRRQLSSDEDERTRLLLDRISAAASEGVDAIQLREKDLSARELVELGTRAIEIMRAFNPLNASRQRTGLLINSRVDVAIACGADGVHFMAVIVAERARTGCSTRSATPRVCVRSSFTLPGHGVVSVAAS